MLEFQNLTIRRDNRTILSQLHMEVSPGTVLGLVGPDEDAKMTILRAAAGIAFPSEGDVLLDGDSVFDKKAGAWMRYGYLSRDHVLFHQLKLFEYYEMYLSLYKIRGRIARIRIEDLIEELDLEKYTDLYLEELPMERKSFVSLGQAILHEPQWLFLDQPFDGLDGAGREKMRSLLSRLHEEGVSIILNCSMLPEVAGMLTDVLVLEEGKVVISGPIEEVVERGMHERPVRMHVLSNMDGALDVLKTNDLVERVIVDGSHVLFRFSGDEVEEARLLSSIVKNGVLLQNYTRDRVNLDDILWR